MVRDPHILTSFLYENPEAWPVRMALIEEMVRDGDIARAKALVRESPDDSPMPPEYPKRIHALMTDGVRGLESLPPLVGFLPRSDLKEKPVEKENREIDPSRGISASPESTSGNALAELDPDRPDPAKGDFEKEIRPVPASSPHQHSEPLFEFEKRTGEVSGDGELVIEGPSLKGGLGALVESRPIRRRKGPKPPAPGIDRKLASIRWENYAGKLHLTGGELPDAVGKKSQLPDRFSAFSIAVIFHLLSALFVSFVVFSVPRPRPPQLIATIPDKNEADDLVVHRLTKPAEIEPSAAAMQAVNVTTSISVSEFSLPDVEDTTTLDVTAMIDGIAESGAGMSISRDFHQQSDVNFFGISSGGKKIVFVIDATPKMLVDEKGGMFAYDKVKSEIASMLVSLNRGTKFNILLYEGKRVIAFRDELVPGLPSNLRLAVEWLDPLNRDYENLGLMRGFGEPIEVSDYENFPIRAMDVAHYTKCIQKAMEWQAAAIFCISSGYEQMRRSPTEEMRKKMMEENLRPGTPGQVDPAEREAWNQAVAKTREWLRKENEARRERGSPQGGPQLQPTGPGCHRGNPAPGEGRNPRQRSSVQPLPPVNFDDIDVHLRKLVIEHYKQHKKDMPSVHMVIFLGEDEDFRDQDKEHFSRIVRRNNGKLKMLRGLAELQDVTAK